MHCAHVFWPLGYPSNTAQGCQQHSGCQCASLRCAQGWGDERTRDLAETARIDPGQSGALLHIKDQRHRHVLPVADGVFSPLLKPVEPGAALLLLCKNHMGGGQEWGVTPTWNPNKWKGRSPSPGASSLDPYPSQIQGGLLASFFSSENWRLPQTGILHKGVDHFSTGGKRLPDWLWLWLKIKGSEGQTAGFGPCFHLPG